MPTTLILTMVGLLFLLIALVFIYVWIGRSRKSSVNSIKTIETFESLSELIKNRTSGTDELQRAAELILEHYGTIEPHALKQYQALIETLCVHPRTDSKLIVRFEKSLRSANPRFAHEIEHALSRGLAARG